MKGNVKIVLKDKQGNIVHKEENHNLVTNFFSEYFRPLGTTREYPYDYNVADMVGGILLMEDAITESANIVQMPAGNKMIGNGAVGIVNGSGTAVTELGSYNSAETGWQDNGDYKMTFEWTPSQANGTISAICLTNKAWGYVGEGNASSHGRITQSANSKYNPYYNGSPCVPMGTGHARSMDSGYMYLAPNGNANTYIRSNNLTYDTTNNCSITGKMILKDYYFPRTSIDFYTGVNSKITPIQERQIDIPSNIISDFTSGHKVCDTRLMTFDKANQKVHFAFGSVASSTFEYIQMMKYSDQSVYCFHYDITNKTMTANKVPLPSGVVEGLWQTANTSHYLPVAIYCNDDYVIIHRYSMNAPANDTYGHSSSVTSCSVYFVKVSDGTYTETTLNFVNSTNFVHPYILCTYHDGVWYISYAESDTSIIYTGSSFYMFKIDSVRKSAEVTNLYTNTNTAIAPFPVKSTEYALAGMGYSSYEPAYNRDSHYIATIYNLQEAVTKTASLTMQITYTLSFTEE